MRQGLKRVVQVPACEFMPPSQCQFSRRKPLDVMSSRSRAQGQRTEAVPAEGPAASSALRRGITRNSGRARGAPKSPRENIRNVQSREMTPRTPSCPREGDVGVSGKKKPSRPKPRRREAPEPTGRTRKTPAASRALARDGLRAAPPPGGRPRPLGHHPARKSPAAFRVRPSGACRSRGRSDGPRPRHAVYFHPRPRAGSPLGRQFRG